MGNRCGWADPTLLQNNKGCEADKSIVHTVASCSGVSVVRCSRKYGSCKPQPDHGLTHSNKGVPFSFFHREKIIVIRSITRAALLVALCITGGHIYAKGPCDDIANAQQKQQCLKNEQQRAQQQAQQQLAQQKAQQQQQLQQAQQRAQKQQQQQAQLKAQQEQQKAERQLRIDQYKKEADQAQQEYQRRLQIEKRWEQTNRVAQPIGRAADVIVNEKGVTGNPILDPVGIPVYNNIRKCVGDPVCEQKSKENVDELHRRNERADLERKQRQEKYLHDRGITR